MTFGGWTALSEEEMESGGGDFTTLPEDEYVVRVTGFDIKKDQPNRFPSKSDPNPTHDMLVVRAEALTFADGEPLVDIEENPVDGTVPFQVWLNPKKKGMIPRPSNTRKFFAAILGQPVGDPIEIGSFDELVGKTLIVSLKPNGTYNNAQEFRPIKRARTRGTTPKGPVDGQDLVARATAIFNEDAPDNTDPVPTLAQEAETKEIVAPRRGRQTAKPATTVSAGSASDDLDDIDF